MLQQHHIIYIFIIIESSKKEHFEQSKLLLEYLIYNSRDTSYRKEVDIYKMATDTHDDRHDNNKSKR